MKEFEGRSQGSGASAGRVGAILGVVVLSAVVVFSLGVMVGKRVTGGYSTLEEPPAALPTENLVPPPSRPAGEGDGEVRAAAEQERKETTTGEKLTFFDTLSKEEATAPPLPKKEERKAAPPPAETEARPAPPAAAPSPQPAPPSRAAASERVKSLAGPGRYFVQVSSSTNRQWSDDLVKRLSKKGLPARSQPVTLKGKQWYRIRVGSFPDKGAAESAQAILKKEMDLDGMVVSGD